jgi:hypothetical protein
MVALLSLRTLLVAPPGRDAKKHLQVPKMGQTQRLILRLRVSFAGAKPLEMSRV